jgi:hypothetical protein
VSHVRRLLSPWLVASLLAIGFSALALSFSRRYAYNIVDDALITVQYARNLALGHGVVFNAGERVEGYTNFLWLALLALAYWPLRALGIDFVSGVIALNVVTAAAVVMLVFALARRTWPSRPWAVVTAVGLTVADNAFGVWAVLGLEKHLVAFWALLALWLAGSAGARRWPAIGLCIACAMLTRPDAALFAAAFFGSQALELLRRGEPTARSSGAAPSWRALVQCAGVFVCVYAAYYAWRYAYYGYPLPNTFYLKASGLGTAAWKRGAEYVGEFLSERHGLPLLSFVAVSAWRTPILRALYLWALAHVLYIVHIGGDFYPGQRFLIVLVPVLALLTGELCASLQRWLERALPAKRASWLTGGAALLVVLVLGGKGLASGPVRTEIDAWGPEVERNRRFMLWLRDHKPPGASIVAGDIGSTGYHGEFRVHDVFGVIDPVIAHQHTANLGRGKAGHEKVGSPAYLLSKHPTFVKWGYLQGDLHPAGYYVRADMPFELGVHGIWQRDPLLRTGHFVSERGFDFDGPGTERWTRTGRAFERFPRRRGAKGQQPILGHDDEFASSYHNRLRDAATGTLRSPPFILHGDQLVLRVGGGRDPKRLRVDLIVAGQTVASATGRDSEVLGRRSFAIAAHRGRSAVVHIVDEATGDWGHILVDEIQQWSAYPTKKRD